MKASKFQRGSGCFKCEACGRMTRQTDQNGAMVCFDCYELAGLDNLLSDEGKEGLMEYAAEVREHCANIVAKGGKLDEMNSRLLAIVGASA